MPVASNLCRSAFAALTALWLLQDDLYQISVSNEQSNNESTCILDLLSNSEMVSVGLILSHHSGSIGEMNIVVGILHFQMLG